MKRILSIIISFVLPLLFTTTLSAQSGSGKLEGTWQMKSHDGALQIEFLTGKNKGERNSMSVSKSSLTGYTGDKVNGFLLRKPGGDIKFTGDINAEDGEGTFVFTPNAGYVKSLADEGFKDLDPAELLLLTLKNTDLNYIQGIKKLGYKDMSKEDLVADVALDITVDYIKAIQDAGFENITLGKLIGFKALKVDPAYIARMKKISGGDLSANDIMSFAAMKIDEKYAEEMYKSGYKLSGKDLIEFKAMGVTPEYVKEMKSAGFDEISQDEIIQLKAQNITPDYIKEIKGIGLKGDLSIPMIVKLKIFKINREYVSQVAAAGYPDLSVDKLVEFSIFKIDKSFIEKATQFLGSKPTPEKLIQLKVAEGNNQ